MAIDSLKPREKIEKSSERSFAYVFAIVFLIIGLWPLTGEQPWVRLWAVGVSAFVLFAGLFSPVILKPFNHGWYLIGRGLFHVTTPLVMLLIYIITIVPIGLCMRVAGKDLLRLKRDKKAATYWLAREHPITPESMKNQF